MTLCPVAIAIGCKKCPVFKICPVKSVIGDVPKTEDRVAPASAAKKPAAAKPAAKNPATKKPVTRTSSSRRPASGKK